MNELELGICKLRGVKAQKRLLEYAYKSIYQMPDIEKIYQEYANVLATTPDKLTNNEKHLALLNAVLEMPTHD